MFQTGYLTIHETKQAVAEIRYKLGYPNHDQEVTYRDDTKLLFI